MDVIQHWLNVSRYWLESADIGSMLAGIASMLENSINAQQVQSELSHWKGIGKFGQFVSLLDSQLFVLVNTQSNNTSCLFP